MGPAAPDVQTEARSGQKVLEVAPVGQMVGQMAKVVDSGVLLLRLPARQVARQGDLRRDFPETMAEGSGHGRPG